MASGERAFVAEPVSAAGGRVIASPFQFYTTGEDRLRVTSVCSLTGVTVAVHGRLLDLGGALQANTWTHTPHSDRTVAQSEIDIGAGAVLNLTVFASAGSPKIGQCFVIVQLIRGVGTAAVVLGTLLQGYVTGTQQLAWPGSPIQDSISGGGYVREVLGTQPAAGGEALEVVPTGARWKLLAAGILCTFDSTGAVRNVVLQITNASAGRNFLLSSNGQTGVSGDINDQFTWAAGVAQSKTSVSVFWGTGPIGVDMALLAGSNIAIRETAGGPGDQLSAPILLVREWLEVQ